MSTEMIKQTRQLRFIFTFVFGFLTSYQIWQARYADGFLNAISWLFPLLILFGLALYSLLEDISRFRKNKTWKSFSSTLFALSFALIIPVVHWLAYRDLNKPTLLEAVIYQDFNGVSIDFKTDGTYVHSDICMGEIYSYGTYKIQGNRFLLKRTKADGTIQQQTWELQKASGYNSIDDLVLVRVDSGTEEFRGDKELPIRVDNRNKH